MDNKEERIIVNQRRQTRWFKDYHTNYKKKLEEHRNAVISEAEKEKTDQEERTRETEHPAQQRKRHLLSLYEAA